MSRTTCRRLCALDPWRNRTAFAADLRADLCNIFLVLPSQALSFFVSRPAQSPRAWNVLSPQHTPISAAQEAAVYQLEVG
jgi:hypothetical protein